MCMCVCVCVCVFKVCRVRDLVTLTRHSLKISTQCQKLHFEFLLRTRTGAVAAIVVRHGPPTVFDKNQANTRRCYNGLRSCVVAEDSNEEQRVVPWNEDTP